MKTRLALIGPPGAGKGTQARFLTSRLGIVQISTGRILRRAIQEDSELGRTARAFMDGGKLVPDKLMYDLVERAIAKTAWNRFVLDGFPRTRAQAEWLTQRLAAEHAPLEAVILMVLADGDVVTRLSRRRIHKITGENFHLDNKPPVGIDPALIVQRADDARAAIRARLRVYHATTKSVVDYYRSLGIILEIAATGTFDEVYARIHSLIQPS